MPSGAAAWKIRFARAPPSPKICKWNSYSNYSEGHTISFQTAWSAPHPVLERLAEMFPDVTITHKWADEDIGMNCGEHEYADGVRVSEYYPEGDVESLDFACAVWDYAPEEIGLTLNSDGTRYINTDYDDYELIELFGKPALFTNERLSDEDVPKGFYHYDFRESDDGSVQFATLEPHVLVNHGGSVITREPIPRHARRNAKAPQSQKQSITASGKYSKYALSEVLICGECGSRYKRVTWSKKGKKRVVWRCINRLDYGTKYCKASPTLDEKALQEAIVRAVNRFHAEDAQTYLTLMKATIGDAIGLNGSSDEIDLLERRIDALNRKMLTIVNESVQNGEDMECHEDEFKEINAETEQLKNRIKAIRESECAEGEYQQRLAVIQKTIEERQNRPFEYDDSVVRQMIECIKVFADGKLTVIFGGGYEVGEQITPDNE